MLKAVFVDGFGALSDFRFFERRSAPGHPRRRYFDSLQAGWMPVAHGQPTEARHPREGPLHDPSVTTETLPRLDAFAGDARSDAIFHIV